MRLSSIFEQVLEDVAGLLLGFVALSFARGEFGVISGESGMILKRHVFDFTISGPQNAF